MGEIVIDHGGVQREAIYVQRQPCPGNESGVVLTYRDQMREGDVEVNPDGSPLPTDVTEGTTDPKPRRKAKGDES